MTAESDITAINDGGANTASEVRTALTSVLARADGVVFDVMHPDYGATGDGTTDDSTELQAAVDACEANGGGIVLYPAGYSFRGGVTIDSNVPILMSGYGATLEPLNSGSSIVVDSGNGNTAAGITIEGFAIDGNTPTSPTGIAVLNTDRVRIRDVRIDDCTTGIRLYTESTGWTEGTSLEHVWIDGCTTGLNIDPASGTSFGETLLLDVGFNDCTTGIKLNNTANIYRSRLLGVTFWLNSSQTGFDIAGDMRGVTGQLAFEAIGTPTSATGIWVASTAVNLDRTDLQIEFTGSINTKVGSAGPDLIWSEGNNWHLSASGAQPIGWALDGDTWPRGRTDNEWTGGGGVSFGPGNAALDVNLYRNAANELKTDDALVVALDLEHEGTNIGFYGTTPAAQSAAYTPSNVSTDRTFDADSTTLDEVADVLGTLIADLQNIGLLG